MEQDGTGILPEYQCQRRTGEWKMSEIDLSDESCPGLKVTGGKVITAVGSPSQLSKWIESPKSPNGGIRTDRYKKKDKFE